MKGITKWLRVVLLDFPGKFIVCTKWVNGPTLGTGTPLLLCTCLYKRLLNVKFLGLVSVIFFQKKQISYFAIFLPRILMSGD